MNTDDPFETRLKALPRRQLPSEWRAEILGAAREVARGRKPSVNSSGINSIFPSWLTGLLWPHPKAWGALAAVWVVILCVNYAAQESEPLSRTTLATLPSPQMRQILMQQEQLFAELVREEPELPQTKPSRPQPHSRREEDFLYT